MQTFIRRTSVCLPLMLALAAPNLAYAAPPRLTSGVLAISAAASRAYNAGLIGRATATLVASGQIAWGLGCLLFDPPDTANAGTPVASDAFSSFHLADIQSIFPSTPAALANSLNHYADVMDNYVSNVRAYRESLDRLSGAQQLGRNDWAMARKQEAEGFQAKANFYSEQAHSMLPSVLSQVNAADPSVLSTPVTLSDLKTIRDQAQGGNIPAFEQFAFDSWGVTAEEKMHLTQGMGALSDQTLTDIYNKLKPGGGAPNVGDALTGGLDSCTTCVPPVPEPETYLFLLIGAGALAFLLRRRGSGGAMPLMAGA